jgi:hypothetical protein
MNSIPLGMTFSSKGESAVVGSLKNIEAHTKKVNAATVTMGALSAGVLIEGGKKALEFGKRIFETADKWREAREAGEASFAGVSDSGLIAAQKISDTFTGIRDSITAAFIDALPTALYVWDAIKEGAVFTWNVLSKSAVAAFSNIGDTFSTLWDNFKTLTSYLWNNWRDLAANMGEIIKTSALNAFENLKRIVTAALDWLKGEEWNLQLKGMTEGANLKELPPLELKTPKVFDEIAGILDAETSRYDAAMTESENRFANLLSDKVEKKDDKEKKEKKTGTKDTSLASIFEAGTAATQSFIARIQSQGTNEAQKQTSLLSQIAKNTKPAKSAAANLPVYAIG